MLAIEVTAMTETPSPICSERADAKNAQTPAANAMPTNGTALTRLSPRPVAALTATWLTVKSSPAATPSRMPLRESWRWLRCARISTVPTPTSALSHASMAASE